jgi:peroxiredoxin
MPTKHTLTLVTVVTLGLTLGLACGSTEDSGTARAEIGSADSAPTPPPPQQKRPAALFPPAADFILHDYRGQQVDLRDYAGKIVVLNFWATWCPPCRYEIPYLVQLRSDFDPADVAILGASIDRGTEAQVRPLLARFVRSLGINYPVLIDSDLRLIRQYVRRDLSTVGVPMTFVFGRDGVLFSTHEGLPHDGGGQPNPRRVLAREIRTLLDGG